MLSFEKGKTRLKKSRGKMEEKLDVSGFEPLPYATWMVMSGTSSITPQRLATVQAHFTSKTLFVIIEYFCAIQLLTFFFSHLF